MATKEIFAPVIIRRSAIFILTELLGLEILMVLIFLLVRLPVHIFQTDSIDTQSIFMVYSTLFVVLSILKVGLMFAIILAWMNDYYEVLQGLLVHKKGIFSTRSTTFSLSNISLQEVKQSLLGKIFKYGTIEIYNPLIKQKFWLSNVPFPHRQLKAIQHESHSKVDPNVKIIPI